MNDSAFCYTVIMKLIVGCDEAGRGAWAGPLVAAAVCLKANKRFNHKLLRDSKKLSPKQREEVFAYLQEVVEIGVGMVPSEEIDRVGLQRANVLVIESAVKKLRQIAASRWRGTRNDRLGLQRANVMAVERAVEGIKYEVLSRGPGPRVAGPDLHIDYIGGFKKYTTLTANYSLHKFGESKFPEIAAASIVAKVTRDRLMVKMAKKFPDYGLELHKGYGTALHKKQLEKLGVTTIHRQSFAPIKLLRHK